MATKLPILNYKCTRRVGGKDAVAIVDDDVAEMIARQGMAIIMAGKGTLRIKQLKPRLLKSRRQDGTCVFAHNKRKGQVLVNWILGLDKAGAVMHKNGKRRDCRRHNLEYKAGKWFCPITGIKVSKDKCTSCVETIRQLPVAGLDCGKEITSYVCSEPCRSIAWSQYERMKEWLAMELRHLRNAGRVLVAMAAYTRKKIVRREALRSQRRASERATSSRS